MGWGMAIFYHCASVKLGVGSIIEPGNWGRIINRFAYRHGLYQREMVFERVRQEIRPQAPSRMEALFACASLEEARAFCSIEDVKTALIYECETLDDIANSFIAPLNAFNLKNGDHDMAFQYWNASIPISQMSTAPTNFMGVGRVAYEVVSMSRLKIISPAINPFG